MKKNYYFYISITAITYCNLIFATPKRNHLQNPFNAQIQSRIEKIKAEAKNFRELANDFYRNPGLPYQDFHLIEHSTSYQHLEKEHEDHASYAEDFAAQVMNDTDLLRGFYERNIEYMQACICDGANICKILPIAFKKEIEDKFFFHAIIDLIPIDLLNRQAYTRTPLMMAAMCNNVIAMYLLVQRGADLEIKDVSGRTAIHYAAIYNSVLALDFLIKNNVNINIQDELGKTPLHYAVNCCNFDAAILLLNNGASIQIRDKKDLKPFYALLKKLELLKTTERDIYNYVSLYKAIRSKDNESICLALRLLNFMKKKSREKLR